MKIKLYLFALLTTVLAAATAFAAPELTVEQGTYNFGTINQGKKVQHNFVIKNSGDAPLQIKQMAAACGCTAVKPSSSLILPGRTAEIQVTFDSANFTGKVQKSVTMTTNAGKMPTYTFNMEGTVAEELQVTPRQLSLGPLAAGATKQTSITLTNRGTSTIKLNAVNVNSSSLQIKPTFKKNELKPGESAVIELAITPRPEAKVLSAYLQILLSSAQRKEITLTVPVYASGAK